MTGTLSRIPWHRVKWRTDAYFSAIEQYEMDGHTPPAEDLIGTDSERDWVDGMFDAAKYGDKA